MVLLLLTMLAHAETPEGAVDFGSMGAEVKAASAEPAVQATTLRLSLPVEGDWIVRSAGDTAEGNVHLAEPSQRRAVDLVQAVGTATHELDGTTVEQYHAYGEPVRAVADGRVVAAIDGVPDSEIGAPNPWSALGNAVIVEHEGGVWSVYAHLRPGSVKVAAGKRVVAGAQLGEVGNSGASSEPHLHFHLQDGPRVEASWGVEAVFHEVALTRDGATKTERRYRPQQGDAIAPP